MLVCGFDVDADDEDGDCAALGAVPLIVAPDGHSSAPADMGANMVWERKCKCGYMGMWLSYRGCRGRAADYCLALPCLAAPRR